VRHCRVSQDHARLCSRASHRKDSTPLETAALRDFNVRNIFRFRPTSRRRSGHPVSVTRSSPSFAERDVIAMSERSGSASVCLDVGRPDHLTAHRPRRIALRPRDARHGLERGSTRCKMQKISAGKFHFNAPRRNICPSIDFNGSEDEHGCEWILLPRMRPR
jgi:hypothetical protein